MIEGQEGVTWDDWVALANACEEHGVEALFRSDHYISGFDESRPVLDAWAKTSDASMKTVWMRRPQTLSFAWRRATAGWLACTPA